MNLEEQIADKLGREISQHIDFELMLDLLKACGWHKIEISRFRDNHHAIDIQGWCESNAQGRYKHRDKIFIFENQIDAVNFALKWL
jgi:hypothetical protein